jgi:hypothetical protein
VRRAAKVATDDYIVGSGCSISDEFLLLAGVMLEREGE